MQRWVYFSHFLDPEKFKVTVITVNPEVASYKFTDDSFVNLVENISTIKTKTWEPFNIYQKFSGKKTKEDAIPQGFAGDAAPSFLDKISRFIRGNFFIPDARRGWNRFVEKEVLSLMEKQRIDMIITTGPPHSSHLAGKYIKQKTNVKWVADFRDPWTEVYYNKLMFKTNFASRYDKWLEKQVLECSDAVITIGPGMLDLLSSKVNLKLRDKFHYVLNGYDSDRFEGLLKNKVDAHFVICHLGVLSDNQPVDAFVLGIKDALIKIGDKRGKIILRLIGKVSEGIINAFSKLQPEVEVEVINYLPHKKALEQIVNADLLFNSLADAGETSNLLISGKLMEYIATGNPVICLGDENGDAAKILEESGCGFVYSRTNIQGISNFLVKVLTNQFEFEKKNILKYSRRQTTLELERILDTV